MRCRIAGVEFGSPPWGPDGPVQIKTLDTQGAEVRVHDTERMGRDGVMPGRDFLGSSTWAFDCYTNVAYAAQARELYGKLHAIWHDPAHRGRAGELVALDYEARGTNEWRRVYGRPRTFDPPAGDKFMAQGRADFGMEFEVMDPRHFSGSEQGLHEHTLRHEGEVVGGWYFPAVFPLRSSRPVGQRQGALRNSGDRDTPVHVTFHGPIEDPVLTSATGWHVGVTGRILWDERVEVDPVRHTVTHFDGNGRRRSIFSRLTRRTQLSRLEIPPGLTNVFFSGRDDTQSSTAVVSWRDAYASF